MTTSIVKVGEPSVYMTDFSGDKQNEHQKNRGINATAIVKRMKTIHIIE